MRRVGLVYALAGLQALCVSAFPDALYLADGSLLLGSVQQVDQGYLLSSPVLGQLVLGQASVLHWARADPNSLREYLQVLDTGVVLGHLFRPVPARRSGADRFYILVPGLAWAVVDESGRPVRFLCRPIGTLSRLTIDYDDLPDGVQQVVVSVWRLVPAGQAQSRALTLATQYIPDLDQQVSVVVAYPASMTVSDVGPEPTLQRPGLVVWERSVRRQHRFSPHLVLAGASWP